jgi:hypothetical protein
MFKGLKNVHHYSFSQKSNPSHRTFNHVTLKNCALEKASQAHGLNKLKLTFVP